MSATALLQKAAQMGATMSSKTTSLMRPHHHQQQPQHHHQEGAHVSSHSGNNNANTTGFGLNFSSPEEQLPGGGSIFHGLQAPFRNKAVPSGTTKVGTSGSPPSGALLQEMMNSLSSASGFEGSNSFEDAFVGGILNTKKSDDNAGGGGGGSGCSGEGLTRDFLGLRAFSQSDILSMAGLGNCVNTSHEQHNQSQKTWQVFGSHDETLVENLTEVIENGTRHQHSDALMLETDDSATLGCEIVNQDSLDIYDPTMMQYHYPQTQEEEQEFVVPDHDQQLQELVVNETAALTIQDSTHVVSSSSSPSLHNVKQPYVNECDDIKPLLDINDVKFEPEELVERNFVPSTQLVISS
ncbi:hypothetical protein GH714_019507 [Hevea brasiliensis]|uniref:Uncharacterized protein n=1 Tax=Hevea brasiliensis TaxID=3981 RepID=A0A6A6LHW1_HEVBR|nr:hypothetical protein GH714_019507 [Hevea brasiliensis]